VFAGKSNNFVFRNNPGDVRHNMF